MRHKNTLQSISELNSSLKGLCCMEICERMLCNTGVPSWPLFGQPRTSPFRSASLMVMQNAVAMLLYLLGLIRRRGRSLGSCSCLP